MKLLVVPLLCLSLIACQWDASSRRAAAPFIDPLLAPIWFPFAIIEEFEDKSKYGDVDQRHDRWGKQQRELWRKEQGLEQKPD